MAIEFRAPGVRARAPWSAKLRRRSGASSIICLCALALTPLAYAQAPSEDQIREVERQIQQQEAAQTEARKRTEAAQQQTEAEAKRKAEEAVRQQVEAEAKRKAEEERQRLEEQARRKADEDERTRIRQEHQTALLGDFVDIPGGTFIMGCSAGDPECLGEEHPAHKVTVKGFRLGKHEVTVAQFRRFVEATGYVTDAEKNAGGQSGCLVFARGTTESSTFWDAATSWHAPGFAQDENGPVVCVSWNDASAYTEWLSRETGGNYRLPSEAQWEYAARGQTATSRFWGSSPDDACEFANVHDRTSQNVNGYGWKVHDCDDGFAATAPAGGLKPNAFGLHSMLGNVWEWSGDCWNASYTGAPADGSAPQSGDCFGRAARGGSWGNPPQIIRASTRIGAPISIRGIGLGFRLIEYRP